MPESCYLVTLNGKLFKITMVINICHIQLQEFSVCHHTWKKKTIQLATTEGECCRWPTDINVLTVQNSLLVCSQTSGWTINM